MFTQWNLSSLPASAFQVKYHIEVHTGHIYFTCTRGVVIVYHVHKHFPMNQLKFYTAYYSLSTFSRQEIVQILKCVVILAAGRTFSELTSPPFLLFLIITPAVLTGQELSPSLVIFIISMSHLASDVTAFFLTQALIHLCDAKASFRRIQVQICSACM